MSLYGLTAQSMRVGMNGIMITVGTWNVENLFLPGEGSGRSPDDEAA